MTKTLEGKVAVITGAGSGIGRASAELFHAEGAKVVLADISGAEQEVAAGLGDGAVGITVDVSSAEQVVAMLDLAESEFGGLDVLFNNAGVEGHLGPLEATTDEDFDRVVAVNVKGVYLAMKHAIPRMRESGGGSIINTASVAGVVGIPMLAVYSATKGAVVLLSKAAAAEYGSAGIRINALCPGFVNTPLVQELAHQMPETTEGALAKTPLGRHAEPSELAASALFLASDAASFVTGSAMTTDGGYTAW